MDEQEYPRAHVGNRLREERERLEIRQEDAALLAGVTRAMWGRYERHVAMPNAAVLMHLIAHGFDVNYILGGTRVITDGGLSDLEEQLIALVRDMDEEGRLAVLRQAKLELARTRADR